MSMTRGRRPAAVDTHVNDLIRGLVADRRSLRGLLDKIESDGCPSIQLDGQKWIDRDWLMQQLRSVLP